MRTGKLWPSRARRKLIKPWHVEYDVWIVS
uniref:Uncharacterized protein n=1 Tax=Tetranychus urticae TaxID=32264 RepID=T1K0J8_TETUR